MIKEKILKWRILLLVVPIALIGGWLLIRPTSPADETTIRQQALSLFAPAGGSSASNGVAPDVQQVEPVVVNLADIPAGVYDPNNQYDRWLRGEIDLQARENIVSELEIANLQAESLALEANPAANGTNALLAPTPLSSFVSLDYTQCCGGGGNVPPDPELAVGPNHVIAVVNVAFQIYNKSGTVLSGPTTFSSFMNSNPNCTGVFDPNVLYDEEADRYMLGIDADGTHYCIAVSQTNDPLGAWSIYAFATATGVEFFDYPHVGVGRDAIYMGANIFSCDTCGFQEARIWAFNKWEMYAGLSATAVTRDLAANHDTPQPLNLHGYNQGTWPSSGPHYLFVETNYNGANHTLFSWNDPFGANTFATVSSINLNTATGVTAALPVSVPQMGGSNVQGNDWRPQDFEYRNGYGWTTMTIGCNPGSGTVNCVRWAQINLSTGVVTDAGVYSSNGVYRFFADLAVNHCNDMAVGYTKSNSSMFPAVWYTGREHTDAAGTLQTEAELKAGEITYTAFDSPPRRWGDYTEMTIDPNGVTFWYLGEYSKNTGTTDGRWGTYIGSFSYGSCIALTPTPSPTTTQGPTSTPSGTPTVTGTPTVSTTPTASVSPTPTTFGGTPTSTLTPAPSPGPTYSPTPGPTYSPTPGPTYSPTPTNSPTHTATATANAPTPTPTHTPTATSTPEMVEFFLYLPMVTKP